MYAVFITRIDKIKLSGLMQKLIHVTQNLMTAQMSKIADFL